MLLRTRLYVMLCATPAFASAVATVGCTRGAQESVPPSQQSERQGSESKPDPAQPADATGAQTGKPMDMASAQSPEPVTAHAATPQAPPSATSSDPAATAPDPSRIGIIDLAARQARPKTETAMPSERATTQPAEEAGTLPRTASPVPLAGLLGLLSVGTGFMIRALRKH